VVPGGRGGGGGARGGGGGGIVGYHVVSCGGRHVSGGVVEGYHPRSTVATIIVGLACMSEVAEKGGGSLGSSSWGSSVV
jgi:hypothetical protein